MLERADDRIRLIDALVSAAVEALTERETEVLRLVAAGCRNQDIARELDVSIKTVEFHLSNIRGKLGVRSRTEAVVRACQMGLLDLLPSASPSRDARA